MHDLSKRLDDLLSRSSHVCDLFTPEGALYRARLRDHAGRLTAADPVRHGAAAAEAFWRKGVYETLSAARGLKQGGQWTPMERAYVVGHVLNGVGHYEHFLWYLLHDFGWSKKVLEKLGPVRLDVISAEEDFGNCKATQGECRRKAGTLIKPIFCNAHSYCSEVSVARLRQRDAVQLAEGDASQVPHAHGRPLQIPLRVSARFEQANSWSKKIARRKTNFSRDDRQGYDRPEVLPAGDPGGRIAWPALQPDGHPRRRGKTWIDPCAVLLEKVISNRGVEIVGITIDFFFF